MKAILYPLLAILSIVFGYSLYTFHQSSHSVPFLASNEISTATWDFYYHWKKTFNKQYTSDQDNIKIYAFKNNVDFVTNFKATHPNAKYTVSLNQFSDLNSSEFSSTFVALNLKDHIHDGKFLTSELPKSVDWRKKNVVTPIKDQGQMGSAIITTAIEALESLYAIKTGNLITLSTQQIVDCESDATFYTNIFNYTQHNGIESDSAYPSGPKGICKFNEREVIFQNSGYVEVPKNDLDQLAAAVSLQPLAVAIDAQSLQMYSGGIINECTTNVDHTVLLVGYDSESTADYWIVKNSWGTSWGENGYARLMKTSGKGVGTCGIATDASYPTWDQKLIAIN